MEVAIPISLYASLLHLMHTLSPSSFHFVCHLPTTSLFLSQLFTFLHPRASFSCYNTYCTFLFPSTVINLDENTALERAGRIKDVLPVHAQQGREYKYYLSLAVNIFIKGWCVCALAKHVCVDARSQLRSVLTQRNSQNSL